MSTIQKVNLPIFIKNNYIGGTVGLGIVGENNFSLCLVKSDDDKFLQSIAILRRHGNEKLKIDGYISFKSYDDTIWKEDFEGCLEQGQVDFTIASGMHLQLSGPTLLGRVTVHVTRKCELEKLNHLALSNQLKIASSKSEAKLKEDYNCLLNNPDSYCDAVLKCGNDSISVHKNILSVRCPVLASAVKKGNIIVNDMELKVLNALLVYIYSGKTDDLTEDLAVSLLPAAKKYQLDELKQICVVKMKSCLSMGNWFNMLSLGDLHDIELKKSAIRFISENEKFSEIRNSEEWKLLKTERPNLAFEILENAM